jgi:hypothetical protein
MQFFSSSKFREGGTLKRWNFRKSFIVKRKIYGAKMSNRMHYPLKYRI